MERFCSEEERPIVPDGFGYLPDRRYWALAGGDASGALPLDEVLGTSAVLLGPAGAGKSHALKELAERAAEPGGRWESYAVVDLSTVQDETAFLRRARGVLDRSGPAGRSNSAGGSGRLLILDGLDECQVPPKVIAGWVDLLGADYDCSDLHVVIAGRPAAFTNALRESVRRVFGIERAHVLAPLRRCDVAERARTDGVDADAFLSAVDTVNAGVLAATPLTLNLLLELFRTHCELPSDLDDLYRKALPLIVNGSGSDRERSGRTGTLDERFTIACRIACHLLLTGAEAIGTGLPLGSSVLTTDQLIAPGTPYAESAQLGEVIRDVLQSPLFVSAGPGLVKPMHASVAAYLAARHLAERRVAPEQLRGLLVQQAEGGVRGILGELHELAAWLVAIRPELGEWLIGLEPEAMSVYSAHIVDPANRRRLVDCLLEEAAAGRLTSGRWYGPTARFGFPGLTDRLRGVLRSDQWPADGDEPRAQYDRVDLALSIALNGEAVDLVPDIAALAAHAAVPIALRSTAAMVSSALDRTAAGPLLVPVLGELAEHPEHDPDHRLRGAVMDAAWPEALTTREVLAALVAPSAGSSTGYQRFLRSFPERMAESDLEVAAEWCAGRPSYWRMASFAGLVQGVLDRMLTGPGAAERIPFVAGWLQPLLRADMALSVPAPLSVPSDGCADLRKSLALALLEIAEDEEDAWRTVEGWSAAPCRPGQERPGRHRLVDEADLPWLLAWESRLPDDRAEIARAAISWCWVQNDQTCQNAAWEVRGSRIWRSLFARHFEPMAVHGPEADHLRELERRRAARRPGPRQWEGYQEHAEAIARLLAGTETGDAGCFAELCGHLLRDPDTGREEPWGFDVRTFPGAVLLPEGAGPGLAEGAHRFLDAVPPGEPVWLGTSELPRSGWIGYLAMVCITVDGTGPVFTAGKRDQWVPVLLQVAFLRGDEGTADGVMAELLEEIARHAPEQVNDGYVRLLGGALRTGQAFTGLSTVDAVGGPALERRLVDALPGLVEQALEQHGDPASWHTMTALLHRLLDGADPGRQQSVLTVLWTGLDRRSGGADPELVARLFAVLAQTDPDRFWPTVLDEFRKDRVTVPVLLCRLVGYEAAGIVDWKEEHIGSLAELLIRHYPYRTEDEVLRGLSNAGSAGHSARDSVIRHLSGRGTAPAVRQLERLAGLFPSARPLVQVVRSAERQYRDGLWRRPTAQELHVLLQDPRHRLVRNAADLTDLVVELLGQFQSDLTSGRLPAAIFRNECGKCGKGQHKDENLISDFLAWHLEKSLVGNGAVLGREVQINRTEKGTGHRVDILLRAQGGDGPAVVVVEAKGSWNPKIRTAMGDQLLEQYMDTLTASHGIYLVFHFPSPSGGSVPVEELRGFLRDQAEKIGVDRGVDIRVVVLDFALRK